MRVRTSIFKKSDKLTYKYYVTLNAKSGQKCHNYLTISETEDGMTLCVYVSVNIFWMGFVNTYKAVKDSEKFVNNSLLSKKPLAKSVTAASIANATEASISRHTGLEAIFSWTMCPP